ncbi:MAG: flagella synthesis protein FlgN [Woeseiaceae bacterium]
MTPTQCKIAFEQNLTESIHHALDLNSVLDNERMALEQKNTTALNDVAVSKKLCVTKLEELDKIRRKIGKECGFSEDDEGPAKLISWCDQHDEIATLWSKFLGIAESCSNVNAANGAIIRVRQGQVNNALLILRDGTADVNTYGPTGRNGGELKTRSLAEA